MSELCADGASLETEKPVDIEDVKFPPFPEPSDKDFDDDLPEEEKAFYKSKFPDINAVVKMRLHCTACDRHLGCSAKDEDRLRPHPMLRTLICHHCHSFYNSGEFDKGEDGSELYCRWCGQGGQVYCCSDCAHVFCAKCIRRNLGTSKIKEIENLEDWKCFKCNPKCLWELRAVCWALLRFCDIRNKVLFHTEDPQLKVKYQKSIATDFSECCKNRKRKEKTEIKKREQDLKKSIIPKLPPTIQVKKFASMNMDEKKAEKIAMKRSVSPKMVNKQTSNFLPKPITIAPATTAPPFKKIRMGSPLPTPIRMNKVVNTYIRPPRPRQTYPAMSIPYNGINPFSMPMPNLVSDNINLSLETLTQGLDMSAVAAYTNNTGCNQRDSDVVCTPDFPLEPLCEVTEDNDDDVECITPGPVATPRVNKSVAVSRGLPDMSSDNIVQMTENDVTVNAVTGGLKFRVDPQTLSSKKMYRLPDGRIFAINPNPNMPGGYSATIVSVSESTGKPTKGGETFAAKVSAVVPSPTPSSSKKNKMSRKKPKNVHKKQKSAESEQRQCDLKVPIEWYRYNLVDAVDALDYSLTRLNKLKKEATSWFLRTRSVDEVKYLHKTLEKLLTTSSKRFLEIRENLNKDLKVYLKKKSTRRGTTNTANVTDDDDDDVEFLADSANDDPIFIDENSGDSVAAGEEVDLTGAASSELNDSTENKNDNINSTFDESARETQSPITLQNDVCGNETDPEQESQTSNKHLKSDEKTDDKTDRKQECDANEKNTEKEKDIEEEHTEVSEEIDMDRNDKLDEIKDIDKKASDSVDGRLSSNDSVTTEKLNGEKDNDCMDIEENKKDDSANSSTENVEIKETNEKLNGNDESNENVLGI